MNSKMIALLASLILMGGTIFGYFWLWTTSKNFDENPVIAENLKPIEIESVKKDAENILNGLEKNGSIPIAVPTEKMGKTNPFVSN